MADVRLIDANTLKERFQTLSNELFEVDDVDMVINSVHTIDPETIRTRWISVKDKLPERSNSVLAWIVESGYTVEDGHAELCDYDSSGAWFDYDGDLVQYVEPIDKKENLREVTHWMPLPEPPNTNAQHAAERISRNDFNKEGWMGGKRH